MKKKYTESVKSLNDINMQNISDFLKNDFYLYRAYGYFCLN